MKVVTQTSIWVMREDGEHFLVGAISQPPACVIEVVDTLDGNLTGFISPSTFPIPAAAEALRRAAEAVGEGEKDVLSPREALEAFSSVILGS